MIDALLEAVTYFAVLALIAVTAKLWDNAERYFKQGRG